MARSLLFDAQRAEDVAQDAWRAALESGPREPGSLRAWLAGVVRRRAADVIRGDARRGARERRAARPESTPSAADMRAREETRRAAVDAVLALEEPYRAALWLRFLEGLPPGAIAKRLGVPVETVRTRVKRGLDLARARLDARFGGDRRAWALALAPLAMRSAWPLHPVILAMSTTNASAAAAAAAVLLLAFLGWRYAG